MRSLAFLLPALLLAGCAAAVPSSPDAAAPEARADAPATLQGEWRLAGVDGKDIDLPHGIAVSIDASRIAVSSGCVAMEWTYRYAGGALETAQAPVPSCLRALFPEEQALAAAVSAASRASRTAANGVELTGGGHSVLLFSQ